MRVKICGITSVADGIAACECGADAVGFIAVPESKRYITPKQYRAIVAALAATVTPVVVAATIADAMAYDPAAIQYYDGPSDRPGHIRAMRALRPRCVRDLDTLSGDSGEIDAFLLDAYHPAMLGGAGVKSDWDLFGRAKLMTSKPLVLSGGLTPNNVADAILRTDPFGVDVSTGVEVSPGVKDRSKIEAFIAAVAATRPGEALSKLTPSRGELDRGFFV